MYSDITTLIDKTIALHSQFELEGMNEKEKHFFIQGLAMAKQLVEQVEEINIGELAYEKFEEVVGVFRKCLDVNDIQDIVSNVIHSETWESDNKTIRFADMSEEARRQTIEIMNGDDFK